MAGNRITFCLVVAGALMIAGCGGGRAATTTHQGEREANVALLDTAIGREMAIVDAYNHGLSLLAAPVSSVGRRGDAPLLAKLRAEDQEHVDALLKAIRGLGGQVDPVKVAGEREALDYSAIKTRADFLTLAYELEGKGVVGDLDEVARLTAGWPRAMIASIATNQAQHLVLLRQALGTGSLGSIPAPFETGTTPAP